MNIRLSSERLGDFLFRNKIIAKEALDECIRYSSQRSIRLGEAAVELGYLKKENLTKALAQFFAVPMLQRIPLDAIDENIIHILGGKDSLLKMSAVPLVREKILNEISFPEQEVQQTLDLSDIKFIIAISDPSRTDIVRKISSILQNSSILFAIAHENDISRVLTTGSLESTTSVDSKIDSRRILQDSQAEKIMEECMRYAFLRKGTDIHIEKPERNEGILIRIRINGVLEEYSNIPVFPEDTYNEVVAFIKVKGGMAPDQRLIPQDGGWRWSYGDIKINVRIATIPTVFRYEKVTLRLLDSEHSVDLESLGFQKKTILKIEKAVTRTTGIILVTGPTGSGKTTTMYGCLSKLDSTRKKIFTVEDPVEYTLPNITQIQINTAQDLTFPKVLRSIMRHDPDIVFVGEIRDTETALIAIQFAMTGHLVLATLHTNDAISAVSRLISLGVPDYLVTSCLSLVVAQRLIRVSCPNCMEKVVPTALQREILLIPDRVDFLYEPSGCKSCGGTGAIARTVVAESVDLNNYPDLESRLKSVGWEKLIWFSEVKNKKTKTMYKEAMDLLYSGKVGLKTVMETVRPGEVDMSD